MMTIFNWLKHNNTTLLVSFIVFWLPLIIFFQLADEVIEKESILFDSLILEWLRQQTNPILDTLLYTATMMGGIVGILILTTVSFVHFALRNQRTRALLVAASVGGATLANVGLKALFQRDRPTAFETFVVETSHSFPSGHAMASSAFVLCMILLFWHTKWRWAITITGILFVAMVGISRPYFGVHYPSDIVAGWCASSGWVLFVFYVVRKFGLKIKPVQSN